MSGSFSASANITPINLSFSQSINLIPKSPFHFNGTFHKPSHFPYTNGVENRIWEHDLFYIVMRLNTKIYGLKLENLGSVEEPSISLTIFSENAISEYEVNEVCEELAYRFDLYTELNPFNSILEKDELMNEVLNRWRGMRILGGSLYENLMIYIVLQNATVGRSVQMLRNMLQNYGTPVVFDDRLLYAFWLPDTLSSVPEEELRALKVGYRAKSFLKLSNQFNNDFIDEKALRSLPNNELKQELLKLYGVGPATVWYIMFEVFHRMDAFEYISPWEQKIYSKLLFGEDIVPAEKILEEVNKRWGRWKMLASHYLFEDLFWKRKNEPVPWLEQLIRL